MPNSNYIPFTADTFYHIYNKGNNGENIFIEERNYRYFLNKVKHYLTPIGHVYAYCLLKNHFHLVIKIKDHCCLPKEYSSAEKPLHQPFSNLFNSYSKSINKAYHRTGSLFQEHLNRIEIDSEEYLKQVICYVHRNPLHHGFTQSTGAYPHSSYSSILSDKPTLLMKNEVIHLFNGQENFKYCHRNYNDAMELE